MPALDETPGNFSRLKLLLTADTKAGKTHYVMQAAAAGFNVLYLDGDVGIQTLKQLPPAAQKRVFYMPIGDYTNDSGEYVSRMAQFFVDFTTSGVLTWNDTKGKLFNRNDYAQDWDRTDPENPKVLGGDVIWQIRPARIGTDTLLVLDSWTTLIQSLIMWKADDLSIDLLEIEKHGREMYTGAGHKATQFLTLLRGLNCHVAVIAHPREYQKRSPPPGSKGQVAEKDMKLDWTKMVPISTSNPHALTMGKHFSDCAWLDVTPAGTRYIDFRPSSDRVIGGHFHTREEVGKLPIDALIRQIGSDIPVNATPDAWLTRYGPGEFMPAGSKPTPAPLIGSSAATSKPLTGLSGLAKLKPGGVQK